MLQVAIVAPTLEILGGQAVQADRLLQAWRDDPDVHAFLVPVNPRPPRPFDAATRVKYLRTLVTEATYLPRLLRDLARADVVHVFSASYSSFLLAPLPAVLAAKLLRRPVVFNYRSGEAPDHLRRSAIARRVLSAVDANVVPSRFLVSVFARFGLGATIVPNVVDLQRFRYRERTSLAPRIISTRNFDQLYNIPCTLRAFRRIQERRPDASLTLVGGGSEEAALRRLAEDLRLRHVTFAGRVAPGEIASLYAVHDIYVQTPSIDNMPVSVLEAYASGLPVVSTDAGCVPAILTHGIHGLLAPVDDDEGIAANVLRLLDDPPFALALARAGLAECDAYTWDAVRGQWLAIYRGVASHTAAPAGIVGTLAPAGDAVEPRADR